jgi:hypothetical protein
MAGQEGRITLSAGVERTSQEAGAVAVTTRGAVAADPASGPPTEVAPSESSTLSARLALIVFAIYLAISFVVLLRLGRHIWFYQDEWQLLTRDLSHPSAYFQPLNQHWVTLPLIVFRVLFSGFGLNYLPYQAVVVAVHLTIVVLLRWVMRRAGVGPWISTFAAGTLVLYGPGQGVILQAIQMSLLGSLAFGIGHLLCADHDGGFTRRDALGLALGALGLMTSGIGTVMVVIVGISVLIRRGWKLALAHTVPLVIFNSVWFYLERKGTKVPYHSTKPFSYIGTWNVTGERAAFKALGGGWSVVAIALAVMLVVGLVMAWKPLSFADFRKQAAVPLALLVGGPIMFALVSGQRYWLPGEVDSSKFIYLATALALPALAVAAAAIARQWRFMAPVVVIALLAAVPTNATKFPADGVFWPGFFKTEQHALLGAAYSPLASDTPPQLQPYTIYTQYYYAPNIQMGFLNKARAHGRLPKAPHLTQTEKDELVVRLSVLQSFGFPKKRDVKCVFHPQSFELRPKKDSAYFLTATEPVVISSGQGNVQFVPQFGQQLTFVRSGLDLTIKNASGVPLLPVNLCIYAPKKSTHKKGK